MSFLYIYVCTLLKPFSQLSTVFFPHFLTKQTSIVASRNRKRDLQMNDKEPEIMAQNPELQFQESISDYCNLCDSLKKRDLTTSHDASGDGQPQLKKRETVSVHDYRLRGFSRVAVPPPNFYPILSRTSSDLINSPGLDQAKRSSLENFSCSPQAMNPNVSTLSPSLMKEGSTELPPLRRSVSDQLPVASPPRTGVSGHGEMGIGSPAVSQENPDPEVGALYCVNFEVFVVWLLRKLR